MYRNDWTFPNQSEARGTKKNRPGMKLPASTWKNGPIKQFPITGVSSDGLRFPSGCVTQCNCAKHRSHRFPAPRIKSTGVSFLSYASSRARPRPYTRSISYPSRPRGRFRLCPSSLATEKRKLFQRALEIVECPRLRGVETLSRPEFVGFRGIQFTSYAKSRIRTRGVYIP